MRAKLLFWAISPTSPIGMEVSRSWTFPIYGTPNLSVAPQALGEYEMSRSWDTTFMFFARIVCAFFRSNVP